MASRACVFMLCLCICFVAGGCSDDASDEPKVETQKERPGRSKPGKKKKQRASVTTPPLQLSQTSDAPAPSKPKSMKTTSVKPTKQSKTPDGTAAIPFTPTEVKSQINVMLVLDASGSMNAPIDTRSKFDYLRTVVKDLLTQQSPSGVRRTFGVQTFGAQYDHQDNNCEDTHTVVPLGAAHPAQIAPRLDSLQARGASPILAALTQATEAFPASSDDADNVILLFADGTDGCAENLCEQIKTLHSGPKKPIIHVVGFDLDSAAQESMRCVAKAGSGEFFLARNVAELGMTADQALNSNLPYNLRVKAFAGDTPLTTTMTVYRSGTKKIVDESTANGIKFFQLPPGSYDIRISYEKSIEGNKPAKLLKGVEVQASARAEQVVRFDLGYLNLSAFAPNGDPVVMRYTITDEKDRPVGELEGSTAGESLALRPGFYSITALSPPVDGIPLQATAERVLVKSELTTDHAFRFESGELTLSATTTKGGATIARYEIIDPKTPTSVLSQGELTADGTTLSLPVGEYTVRMIATAPHLQLAAPITHEKVGIRSQETSISTASFPIGTLKIEGFDNTGKSTASELHIRPAESQQVAAHRIADNGTAEFTLAPGNYAVTATRVGKDIIPAPSIHWENILIEPNKTNAMRAEFTLGNLKLRAHDARENALSTQFTLYRSGARDTALATMQRQDGKAEFKLTPGLYDIRAQDMSAKGSIRPTQWIKGIVIAAGGTVERSLVFTAGRVRLTCRGTNDAPVHCDFRLFTYGQDAPLVAGQTFEEWKEFEMKPGYYYLEVAYEDMERDHELKKWINIAVAENETVETVVRF